MKQFILLSFILTFSLKFLIGQTYRRDTSTLNIFTINDTLKYFEFYTPGYFHGNVETGFVVKGDKKTHIVFSQMGQVTLLLKYCFM